MVVMAYGYFLIDVSIINSYILSQGMPLFPKMTLKVYIISLAEDLMSAYNSVPVPVAAPPSARFCEHNFLSKSNQ